MSSFVISIPKDEPELRDQIEEQLARYARVNEAPKSFTDLNQIKLIVEIIAATAAAGAATTAWAVNTTKIIEFLLMLKDRHEKSKQPSGIRIAVPGKDDVALDDVDETILKKYLGLEKS